MGAAKSMPILVVDDYNTMIRIVRNLLRSLGFTYIDEASDGRTALSKLKARDYALVIAAAGGGAELVSRIRAEPRLAATPVVLVSEAAATGPRAGALRAQLAAALSAF